MTNINVNKRHINIFLSKFNEDINNIYGGTTENTLEKRKYQHINNMKPYICNSSWKISQKPITTINIKNINNIKTYKDNIALVEQYLIDELDKKYGEKCINSRNNDGSISQRGGAGVQLEKIHLNDAYKFYIFYN